MAVSTGWVLRLLLAKRKVAQVTGVTYAGIDDAGVHVTVEGEVRVVPADTVVICTGQEPARSLYEASGFVACGPFDGYRASPNSAFMTRTLDG